MPSLPTCGSEDSMVDRDKIEGMVRHLRQYTTYLQEIVEQDQREFLGDPRSIGSARYYLQVSIETCINIANHIIATDGYGPRRIIRTASGCRMRLESCLMSSLVPCGNWPGCATSWCTSIGMWMTK